jgi:hypothetical protein
VSPEFTGRRGPALSGPVGLPFDPERKAGGYLLFLGTLIQAKGVDLARR